MPGSTIARIAADRALAAADLLPQRSQAYAATLCWAARYAIASGDEAKATAIYKRYVATGAYQAWAKDFGGTCVAARFRGGEDLLAAARHDLGGADGGLCLAAQRFARCPGNRRCGGRAC